MNLYRIENNRVIPGFPVSVRRNATGVILGWKTFVQLDKARAVGGELRTPIIQANQVFKAWLRQIRPIEPNNAQKSFSVFSRESESETKSRVLVLVPEPSAWEGGKVLMGRIEVLGAKRPGQDQGVNFADLVMFDEGEQFESGGVRFVVRDGVVRINPHQNQPPLDSDVPDPDLVVN